MPHTTAYHLASFPRTLPIYVTKYPKTRRPAPSALAAPRVHVPRVTDEPRPDSDDEGDDEEGDEGDEEGDEGDEKGDEGDEEDEEGDEEGAGNPQSALDAPTRTSAPKGLGASLSLSLSVFFP